MPNVQPHLNEFREHLEKFYASLKLAPPYNSIEKALAAFSSGYDYKSQQEHVRLDETLRQSLYQKAVIESGLYKKHRGIIAGLLKGTTPPAMAQEYQYLLQLFLK